MKRFYLVLTIITVIGAVILLAYYSKQPDDFIKKPLTLNDEEYLIYPSDSTGKWNIIFPSGNEYVNLKPEQIGVYLKTGEIPDDANWVIYPQSEYQLTMEDTTIIVSDFGRHVCELPYHETGKLGKELLKDNE